jgi:FkbM family methyltransferase
MKVFIDGGAYNGDTIKQFLRGDFIKRKDLKEFKIFAFEPMFPELPNMIHKAISNYDGVATMNGENSLANSIEKDNIYHEPHQETLVMNFPKWFKRKFQKDDYIIIKLDIEGSEYDILDTMIEDKTLSWVNILFCEFHSQCMKDGPKRTREIKDKIKKLKVKLVEWK